MNYKEIIQELESRGIMPNRPPSLAPMQAALARLNLHIPPEGVVIIAGTNGKGTTAASLEALLISAGERVGLYTSPHLEDTCERIRVNGVNISERNFSLGFEKVIEATHDLSLSHFEMITLIAAWFFFHDSKEIPRCTRVILEVGLGGTWDATNAIPHGTSVIAMIDYDHQDLLGGTLQSIALNKFGVIPRNAPQKIIRTQFSPEVEKTFEEFMTKDSLFHSGLHQVTRIPPLDCAVQGGRPPKIILKSPWGQAALALPGKRSAENSLLALTAFEALGYDPKKHLNALNKTRWPGRFEWIENSNLPCPLVLSGDHNHSGALSLIEILKDTLYDQVWIVAGIGRKKDFRSILDAFIKIPRSHLALTETPFQGLTIKEYGSYLNHSEFASASQKEALAWAISRAKPQDIILITGSLYLVGQIRKELQAENLTKSSKHYL